MKRFSVVLLLVLAVAFGYGVIQLFKIRFEAGDIYPPYSSLRTDPLGTKALYDSFQHLLSAERNFKPSLNIDRRRGTTLFVLGIEPGQLRADRGEVMQLEHYVMTGGRLVVSFLPIYSASEINVRPRQAVAPGQPATKPSREKKEDDFGILLNERWKFGLGHTALARDEANTYKPDFALKTAKDDLPSLISCHTALCFERLDPAWRVIYQRSNDCAVLIERNLGSGSIVIAADSYPFSNEALLKERQPKLLAWFGGGVDRMIFDETHLGVQENRGIAALARKYRLHGFAAGLLLLAGLFVWRYSFSLVPHYEKELERDRGDLIAGKEAAAGFTNLLRRNIPTQDLLRVCIEEWNKSCRHRVPLPRLEKVQTVIDRQNALPDRERNPIAAYQQIAQALARSAPKKS
jgi:hypothetical protein